MDVTKLFLQNNLLPGIAGEITLGKIIPKLSWRDVYTLSSVSRAWNSAVRSRQVYNASLPFRLPPTFIVSVDIIEGILLLHSVEENLRYKLPPIPDVPALGSDGKRLLIPLGSQHVTMDGKIYVLGGGIESGTWNRVFVFDVAAGGKWEQCANMKEPRQNFACAVKDGKIYVFGGLTITKDSKIPESVVNQLVNPAWNLSLGDRCHLAPKITREIRSTAEVYDSKENAWSPIKPIRQAGCRNLAQVVGEEIWVISSDSVATYHPVKDEWRVVQHTPAWAEICLVFVAQGKTHAIRKIRSQTGDENEDVGWSFVDDLYDIHENSWTRCHSFSLDGVLPTGFVIRSLNGIFHVEDELLAVVQWRRDDPQRRCGQCLLQSKGFSNGKVEISWELRDLGCANFIVRNYSVLKL